MLFWNNLLNDKRFRKDPKFIETIAGEISGYKGQVTPAVSERANSNNARADLYKEFGSNFRWTGRQGADALAGAAMQSNPAGLVGSSSGAAQAVSQGFGGSSSGGSSSGGFSGGGGKTLNQTNNFLTQPVDPHTFAADIRFEVAGM
jgi:hypothetical protein